MIFDLKITCDLLIPKITKSESQGLSAKIT